ncbi:hypothetical protein FYC62_01645 [Pedobacter aquae]|uniref:Uncharacterized protein n=1 Tax=Pedobacter aquae TaxID=2605747 RepID=A0A5C0VF76_9SPHI|nr:hypothetical protein [Pedobacter aquae]QEK50513.1 hypothetical protein FYC62_01645 [Pedobacter aquae]
MKYIYLFFFLSFIAHPVLSQQKSIKKAKLAVVNVNRVPFNIDRMKDGANDLSAGTSVYKDYICKGKMNFVSFNWYSLKASSNPLANLAEGKTFYFLKKDTSGSYYQQIFLCKKSKKDLLQISKANLKAILGAKYNSHVDALKKISVSGVKKIVQQYNIDKGSI